VFRLPLVILGVVGFWLHPSVTASDDESTQNDLEESVEARLFVAPVRIETTSTAKKGECAALGPEELTVSIRGRLLNNKVYGAMIKNGLVTLDRRPRPMLHAMVFDTSGSMSPDLPEAKAAALAYLETTLGDLDKGMVVGFDDAVTLWQRVTSDSKKLRSAIGRVEVAGQTSLFDALVNTIRELDAYRARPVIVLLSDGSDNASFYDADDVIAELRRRPDLVVFAIGIGDRSTSVRDMLRRITTTTFGQYFEVETGQELSAVFDEIQDILGTEAVLSVVDPEPTAELGEIEVTSFNSDCSVSVLGKVTDASERMVAREPVPMPPSPLPASYRKPLSEAHRKLLARGELLRDSTDCYDERRSAESQLTQLEFDVDLLSVRGCAPDITLSHGYLYQPGATPFVARNDVIQTKLRPFAIELPRFEELEEEPAFLLDALLAALPEHSSPGEGSKMNRDTVAASLSTIPPLVHGTTFLEMRPRLARAFVSQPGYGDWAIARLASWVESDVDLLETRYLKLFPEASAEAVKFAARNSNDAKTIRARLEAPTDIDLQPLLAAWLGDIESFRLFEAWERRAIDRWLGPDTMDEESNGFVDGWRKLRDLLSLPSNARVMAPLVPMYEAGCDCVGFYRIILPRPGLMRARAHEQNPFLQGPRLDVAPKLPFGYALLQAVTRQIPEVGKRLRATGYRVSSIDYELLGPPEFHDPVRAFQETRVRLEFVAPPVSDNGSEPKITLVADLHLAIPPPRPPDLPGTQKLPPRRQRWLLDKVEVKVRHDSDLKEMLGGTDEVLAGYELPIP